MSVEDMDRYEQQVIAAKRLGRGAPSPEQIRALREKLGLSQRRMSEIVGGGVRSINKYEAGQVVPSAVMSSLLQILVHDPSLINLLGTTSW
jgi:HTH-type transcriptional regulator/antitoxin MqsA